MSMLPDMAVVLLLDRPSSMGGSEEETWYHGPRVSDKTWLTPEGSWRTYDEGQRIWSEGRPAGSEGQAAVA